MSHAHHASAESLWISVILFLAALAYLRQWLRVAWLVPGGVKLWRAWSFFVGLLLAWIGLGSPVSLLDHDLLTVHMVQHLLLMTLAPPLILLGAPWKLLPERSVQRLVELIDRQQWARIQHLGRVLAHPIVCWLGAAGTLVAWHIPEVFMLGMRSGVWHGIEQVSFLVTGLLFWWPVIEPSRVALKWPASSMLVYLFLATLPCDILSGFLVFCDRVVYPVYFSSSQSFGMSALEDQQCAGALMWTCVTVVYLIAGAIVATRLLSPHRSEQPPGLQFEPERSAMQTAPQRMEAV